MNPADLPFPLAGVNKATEYELQPELTTIHGRNVRAQDPLLKRLRGGSRHGQSKYIDERVGGIDGPIQHLNYIVDPTTAALLTKFEQDDAVANPGDYVADPSTNNDAGGVTDPDNPDTRNPSRSVPPDGSGVPPNRDVGDEGDDGGNPPTARADTAEAVVGGPAVEIDVLLNDDYLGTPTITISSGPTAALTHGSSVTIEGVGSASRMVYTPGPVGSGYDDEVGYRLSATGNSGTSGNIVRITVSPEDTTPAGLEITDIFVGPTFNVGKFTVLFTPQVPDSVSGGTFFNQTTGREIPIVDRGVDGLGAWFAYDTSATPEEPAFTGPGDVVILTGLSTTPGLLPGQLPYEFVAWA